MLVKTGFLFSTNADIPSFLSSYKITECINIYLGYDCSTYTGASGESQKYGKSAWALVSTEFSKVAYSFWKHYVEWKNMHQGGWTSVLSGFIKTEKVCSIIDTE